MRELLTKILNNLNCNSSYCQEYEYNVNSENFCSWKLYVKTYEMYSALLLYNEVLNKDISEILIDKNRRVRGIYDGTSEKDTKTLMEDMELLFNEKE